MNTVKTRELKNTLFVSALTLSLAFFTHSTPAGASTLGESADTHYEEIGYDELLQRLSSKTKRQTAQSYSAFDEINLHASIGYLNSFADIKTSAGTLRRHQNGLQLAIGMDLFSPNWYSEGSFKNFGVTSGVTDEVSIKEMEIKLGYKNQINKPWSFIVNSGLSNRFLKFQSLKTNEKFETTTPSMLVGLGLEAAVASQLSLSFEMNGKSPIVNETNDRGSYDFAIRMNATL